MRPSIKGTSNLHFSAAMVTLRARLLKQRACLAIFRLSEVLGRARRGLEGQGLSGGQKRAAAYADKCEAKNFGALCCEMAGLADGFAHEGQCVRKVLTKC